MEIRIDNELSCKHLHTRQQSFAALNVFADARLVQVLAFAASSG